MESHAVVRTDRMGGTDVRSQLVSVRYMGADGESPADLDNGNVLHIDELEEGQREIYVGKDVTSKDSLDDVVLIATPEVLYDERKKRLEDFYNKSGRACRGYRLHNGDIFSVTKLAFADNPEPAVGDIVELKDGTKLSVVKSATEDTTTVGTIIAINNVGRLTYYAVLVKSDCGSAPAQAQPEPAKKEYEVPSQADSIGLGSTLHVSDLIADDIAIAEDGKVTGTIHYVKEFKEFSPGDPGLQSGNYFPIKLTGSGSNMVLKKNGSVSKSVEFDPDIIFRVSEQSVVFDVEVDSKPVLKLDFSTATLETGEEP